MRILSNFRHRARSRVGIEKEPVPGMSMVQTQAINIDLNVNDQMPQKVPDKDVKGSDLYLQKAKT